MSGAAETVRAHLLKRRADLALRHAEALWAAIERGGVTGAEVPAVAVAEFEQACNEAERMLLEYSTAGETPEPECREGCNLTIPHAAPGACIRIETGPARG